MRLFVAVPLAGEALEAAVSRLAILRAHATRGNFTAAANLHLTLAFLGEVEPASLERLKDALDGIAVVPFALRLGSIGVFTGGRERILHLQADGGDALAQLAETVRRELTRNGFAVALTPFAPHVTLVRGGDVAAAGILAADALSSVAVTVDGFTLFESLREEGRLVYRPRFRFPPTTRSGR